jgi:VWFA-related protein
MRMLGEMKAKVGACTAIAAIYSTLAGAPIVSQTPVATGQTSVQSALDPVSLDLAVRDRHNRPVLDLKPEEITVTDNGTPAKLTEMRLVTGEQQNEPLITLLFDRPGTEDNKKRSDDALFGSSDSSARGASKKLRQMAARFLGAFPDKKFRFAVVDSWGRLQIQQEASESPKATEESVLTAVQPDVYGTQVKVNAVERRLAQVAETGRDSSGATASVQERTLARSMYTAMQTSSRIAKDQHLSPSQACLLALVEAQQSLPGRKAIVYFTSIERGTGDPWYRVDSDNHAKEGFKSIAGAANRAGVSIYVVLPDALQDTSENDLMAGMSSADQAGGIGQMNAGPRAGPTQQSVTTQTLNWELIAGTKSVSKTTLFGQDNMALLAKQTGGVVLNGSARMTAPARDIARSLTTYYEASFDPPSGGEDGTFHTTAFKISRRGLRMRARTGYLAIPPSAGIDGPPQPFELPLMALLKARQLREDIDYRARVMHMGHGAENNICLLALEVPVSGLEVRTDSSTHLSSVHVSVLVTVNHSAGTEIARFSEDIVRRWSTESSAGSAPAFISFERSFTSPPGKYVLETAILDNNSVKAATNRQTFEEPASHSVPELSDLMVVRGTEPPDDVTSEQDPLWRGERRVLPNLYGELPSGAQNISIYFLAHTDPKSQAPATVKLEVLRNGAPLKGKPMIATLKAGDEFSPVMTAFSIRSAVSGKYEVRVTLTQGEKPVEKSEEFVLLGAGGQIASGETAPTGDAPVAADPPALTAAEQTADRLSQEEQDRILADARKSALDYADALPNLICRQITRRFDGHGNGDWRLKDTVVEVLTYVNHEESRTLVGDVTVGETSRTQVSSSGEFGSALSNIFKPESKAEFKWKETGMLRGEPAEVFDYSVERESSPFELDNLSETLSASHVAYHGRIYIDRATHAVKSLTIVTEEQPKKFPIHKVAIRVDYDYVAINDHDYLLPVGAQLVTKVKGNVGDLLKRNDLTFSNFHKFGSTARILGLETKVNPQ